MSPTGPDRTRGARNVLVGSTIRIGLQVVREGDPDDGDEVAVVFRGLALSGFQAPTEEPPAPESEEPAPSSNPVLRP